MENFKVGDLVIYTGIGAALGCKAEVGKKYLVAQLCNDSSVHLCNLDGSRFPSSYSNPARLKKCKLLNITTIYKELQ